MSEPTPRLAEWPIPRPSFELGAERTALIVVDMQEAQCDPESGMGRLVRQTPGLGEYFFERLEIAIPNQELLLRSFRENGRRVVFLTIGPQVPDGSDMAAWKRRRNEEMASREAMDYAAESQPSRGVIARLAPRPEEPVLHKATFGGFLGTGLDQVLRGWGVDQLLLCGLATNVCVYTTAIEAADRGYECAMVEDACAAWAPHLHDTFIENFGLLYGRTGATAELLRELAGGAG